MVFFWYLSEIVFIIIIEFIVFAIENEFSRKEKSSNTTSSRRENSKRNCTSSDNTHMSIRDISRIIRKSEGISSEEKSVETQALDLFYQGKKPIEVAVELNLNSSKILNSIKII